MDGLQGFTVAEAAQRTTLSTKTIYRLIQSGRLRAIRSGPGKASRIVIPAQSLQDYLEGVRPSQGVSRRRLPRRRA